MGGRINPNPLLLSSFPPLCICLSLSLSVRALPAPSSLWISCPFGGMWSLPAAELVQLGLLRSLGNLPVRERVQLPHLSQLRLHHGRLGLHREGDRRPLPSAAATVAATATEAPSRPNARPGAAPPGDRGEAEGSSPGGARLLGADLAALLRERRGRGKVGGGGPSRAAWPAQPRPPHLCRLLVACRVRGAISPHPHPHPGRGRGLSARVGPSPAASPRSGVRSGAGRGLGAPGATEGAGARGFLRLRLRNAVPRCPSRFPPGAPPGDPPGDPPPRGLGSRAPPPRAPAPPRPLLRRASVPGAPGGRGGAGRGRGPCRCRCRCRRRRPPHGQQGRRLGPVGSITARVSLPLECRCHLVPPRSSCCINFIFLSPPFCLFPVV